VITLAVSDAPTEGPDGTQLQLLGRLLPYFYIINFLFSILMLGLAISLMIQLRFKYCATAWLGKVEQPSLKNYSGKRRKR